MGALEKRPKTALALLTDLCAVGFKWWVLFELDRLPMLVLYLGQPIRTTKMRPVYKSRTVDWLAVDLSIHYLAQFELVIAFFPNDAWECESDSAVRGPISC